MLRSIVICPDKDLAERLQGALADLRDIAISRTLGAYPNGIDLLRTVRAHAPDLVFLSFESIPTAQEIVKALEREVPGIQIIAIHKVCDANVLRETMRVGLREFLADPFERQAVVDCLRQVNEFLQRKPAEHSLTSQVFSFLPSKAGVGTSTLALNVATAMAKKADMRVLLSDFDLNSGMIRFLLKLQNNYSIFDAVEHAGAMDEALWPQLVTSIGKLDVLHAGRINPGLRIEPAQVRNLVAFMRRNYDSMCFDLSGNLERYALEIMQESKRIILVCTPEIPSLHLAREKIHFLREVDLESRVVIALTRVTKKPVFGKEQVQDVLGVPVIETIPNDYAGVNDAMAQGRAVSFDSELGKQYVRCADRLIERQSAAKEDAKQKKKFLEHFFLPGTAVAQK